MWHWHYVIFVVILLHWAEWKCVQWAQKKKTRNRHWYISSSGKVLESSPCWSFGRTGWLWPEAPLLLPWPLTPVPSIALSLLPVLRVLLAAHCSVSCDPSSCHQPCFMSQPHMQNTPHTLAHINTKLICNSRFECDTKRSAGVREQNDRQQVNNLDKSREGLMVSSKYTNCSHHLSRHPWPSGFNSSTYLTLQLFTNIFGPSPADESGWKRMKGCEKWPSEGRWYAPTCVTFWCQHQHQHQNPCTLA